MRHNDPRKAPRGNCHLQSSPESQLKCADVLIGLSIKNMVIQCDVHGDTRRSGLELTNKKEVFIRSPKAMMKLQSEYTKRLDISWLVGGAKTMVILWL